MKRASARPKRAGRKETAALRLSVRALPGGVSCRSATHGCSHDAPVCVLWLGFSIKTVRVAGKSTHVHAGALGAGSSRAGTVFSPLQFMRILRQADKKKKKYSTLSFIFYGPLAE